MKKQIERFTLDELKNKTHPQIKEYLSENSSSLYDSLLFEQRTSRIVAIVDTIIVIKNMESWAKLSTYDYEQYWDDENLTELLILASKNPFYTISDDNFSKIIKDKKLHTNFFAVLTSNDYFLQKLDSSRIEKYFASVDKNNVKQLFNFANFLTNYWYRNFSTQYALRGVAKTITPEDLLEWIEPLSKSPEISTEQYNKLKFNIYLSGVLYYTAHNGWQKKDKYFDAIVDYVRNQEFNVKEAEKLALFFNYFHKFERAVKLLSPYFDRGELSENGIFWLAETAVLVKRKLDPEQFFSILSEAKKTNQLRYCTWLNEYFQILRDETIKQDFCETCSKKKLRRK